jgi:glucose-1-phosphate thymidylyltransferase
VKALILAGGYATRLYPLTKKFPKPLIEIKGRPIIDYIIDKLELVGGLNEIYVVTNNKFITNFRRWAKTVKSSKKITLVNDLTRSNRDRLGAIGDINFVIKKKKVKDDLLVVGGDNLFSGSLQGFLDASRKHVFSAGIGLYKLKHKKDASRYGVVKLDKLKRVIGFQEKPRHPESSLVAMCLYYFSKNYLYLVNAYLQEKKKKADATGSYIIWLKDKAQVYGHVFSGSWFDIGDYKYLNEAKEVFIQ